MSDYIAVKQHVTMEFTCYGCNHSLMIDPNNQDEVKEIEPWLKLQDSAGASLGFCGPECLREHVNISLRGGYKSQPAQKIEIVTG